MDRPIEELCQEWRAQAEWCEGRGLEGAARMLEACARDLEQRYRGWLDEALTLEEAAAESGYAYDTIQRQVASGELGNAGEKGSPRVLRRDLPRRAPRTRPRHLRLEGEEMVEDMVTRALTARRAGTL